MRPPASNSGRPALLLPGPHDPSVPRLGVPAPPAPPHQPPVPVSPWGRPPSGSLPLGPVWTPYVQVQPGPELRTQNPPPTDGTSPEAAQAPSSGRAAGAATLSQVPPRSAPPSCCRLQTHSSLPSPHKIHPGPRITGPERTTRLAPAARPRLPLPSRPAASMLRVAPRASLRPSGAWDEAPSFLNQPGTPTAFASPLSRRSRALPDVGRRVMGFTEKNHNCPEGRQGNRGSCLHHGGRRRPD